MNQNDGIAIYAKWGAYQIDFYIINRALKVKRTMDRNAWHYAREYLTAGLAV